MEVNWIPLLLALGVGLVVGFVFAALGRSRPPTPAEIEGQIIRLRTQIEDQARKFEALPNLLASLSSVQEADKLFSSIAFVTREHLSAEYSALFLRNDKDFVIQASEGLSEESRQTLRLPVKEGLVRYIMETNSPVRLVRGDRQMSLFRNLREPLREVMVAPLRTGGEVFGLLWVANHSRQESFGPPDMHLISYLGIPFSLAIHNASVFSNSQRTVVDMLIEISRQLEERDPFARGHSSRVAEIAVRTGQQLRMSPSDLETLRVAARLHDLGKLALPVELWHKPGPFNEKEWDLVKIHPRRAVDLLKPLGYVDRALPLILYHHEKYDGSGYPFGLRGTAVPVGAAVISMAETLDSLVHDQPYRKAMSMAEAQKTLAALAGTQFDPQLLRQFMVALEKETARGPVVA